MDKTRVLIVDDSAFMRKMISDFLSEHPLIEVAGTARNGADALVKMESTKPDVVTLDVEMPVMDGIQALKEIMKRFPCPVIMLSSTTQQGAENTIRSFEYGAADFIAKPSGPISLDLYKIKEEMQRKVLLAKKINILPISSAQIDINKLPKQENYSKIGLNKKKYPFFPSDRILPNVIGMGTSTGGPRALQKVLPLLPEDIEAPLFIVQHMPAGFTQSLATRLNQLSKIQVKEAADGEKAVNGTAYIAPGGRHMTIKKEGASLYMELDQSPAISGHRPSVDVLFQSLSELAGYQKYALVLTGMGSDGTEGLKMMKKTGSTIAIAESQATSVVFGMPKSIIAANLADAVDDIEMIAVRLMNFIRS
ncbi:chemotaxis response regulator protein-glutamate methylesterase [Metabacillus sp. GX 13764]|uniref:protein-glutamate methylesterase/protein-glutamine glutaminase n=1 Tax=Metabacillus kandeliae TaxID=2900151 RepID=UPI001E5A0546|nr:chemotaxis response regulator protein-glutamate methylesterase [Metabacillus kandeliae]